MGEKDNRENLPMGDMDMLQMFRRMERLKKLMGTPAPPMPSKAVEKPEKLPPFSRNRQEDMISAAIPFLDREYQKGIYVLARLMEMKRVLGGGALETRERQEEPSDIRRQKMICAIQQEACCWRTGWISKPFSSSLGTARLPLH